MLPFKDADFNIENIPNLTSYVALVTGGNSGIGYETTVQLALRGARVYIAARSPERVMKAIVEMRASCPTKELDLHFLSLNLQSLKSVEDAAKSFMTQEKRLDLLINNAGIMAVPFALTEDGFETQWQINYLSQFLFIRSLLPLLETTAANSRSTSQSRVRIVNVSSDAAFAFAPKTLDLKAPNLEYVMGPMAAWKRYGHSKLALLPLTAYLHSHFFHLGIATYAVHPGIVSTNLQAADPTFIGSLIRHAVKWKIIPGLISVLDGVRTTLFCAVAEGAVEGSGRFFVPFGKRDGRGDKVMEDVELVERIWRESERMVGEKGF